jgi:hypothetical protein
MKSLGWTKLDAVILIVGILLAVAIDIQGHNWLLGLIPLGISGYIVLARHSNSLY